MTTETRTRRRRLRADAEGATTAENEVETAENEVEAQPESPSKPRGRAATKPKTETEAQSKSRTKPKTEPKAEKPAPVSTGAGRPSIYEPPSIEGEVDDLPNATGVAKAAYRDTVAVLQEKAAGGSQAWTIINPMGRKPNTVQTGIKDAAGIAGVTLETRIIKGDDGVEKVYVRIKPSA